MNKSEKNNLLEISNYQLQQFQTLVTKLFQCCQERIQYQSERFELPDAELRCLILFDEERYLTSKSVSYKMNVVKSRVTKLINGLVKKKLVQRIPDPEDSRITLLMILKPSMILLTIRSCCRWNPNKEKPCSPT